MSKSMEEEQEKGAFTFLIIAREIKGKNKREKVSKFTHPLGQSRGFGERRK
jgi:hypothetical protein